MTSSPRQDSARTPVRPFATVTVIDPGDAPLSSACQIAACPCCVGVPLALWSQASRVHVCDGELVAVGAGGSVLESLPAHRPSSSESSGGVNAAGVFVSVVETCDAGDEGSISSPATAQPYQLTPLSFFALKKKSLAGVCVAAA